MIRILINDTFKKFLLSQTPEYRKKVRQKMEYLEIGYWDGGLKVKKIKSMPGHKAVFEARLDRANRILFTLGLDRTPTAPTILIYIWGIVGHDDIASRSRSIPTNVPFLQFTPFLEEEHKDGALEHLEPDYYTQEGITQKTSDDSASQKWHFLDPENWQRIEAYRQDEFELALYLTPEQQEILNKALPILVSGTAGSGKTSMAVYYLLQLPLAKQKKLFITYNHYLKNSAFKLYQGLLNASALKAEYRMPDFYTFKEFCFNVARHFHRSFSEENELTYERFCQLMSSSSLAHKFDLALIWEEIRSIIKGALPQMSLDSFSRAVQSVQKPPVPAETFRVLKHHFQIFANMASLQKIADLVRKYLTTDMLDLSQNFEYYLDRKRDHVLTTLDRTLQFLAKERDLTQKKYLSLVDYEAIGKKKAPNFYLDRQQIYQIFEWYQAQLERNGWWDELDLAREVLHLLSERTVPEFQYDLIVCDEVQDLTDIQHELLFYLTPNPIHLFLTGDTRQIINPSGFRWEELKRHFYERNLKTPELNFLSLNFRSSGSIVELSNTLLALKSALLGVRAEEPYEDWKYKGRPPVVVHNLSEAKMLEGIKKTGARKTILVRTEAEKDRLKASLETELIFTINEAKGLEFETVLLWKFAADAQINDIWKVILQESNRDVHLAQIRHEINLLYVAITRAQSDLLIYDGKQSSLIWDSELVQDKIYLSDDLTYISKIWDVISSPVEWQEQGDYFFEHGYYKAAMECYKNAGAEDFLLKATVYDAEKRQDFSAAAIGFEKLGMKEKAAFYFEKSQDLDKAIALWRELRDRAAIERCHRQILIAENCYAELAEIYLAEKNYSEAYRMYTKAENYEKAAKISSKYLKKPAEAAQSYEKARLYPEAARLYRQLGQIEKSAEMLELAQDYDQAVKIWKKLRRNDRIVKIYQQTQNLTQLLAIYEKQKDQDNTVKILRRLSDDVDLRAEAEKFWQDGKYFQALVRFQVLNDLPGQANCYLKLREYERAISCFVQLEDHYHAGIAYAKLKNHYEAFWHLVQSPEEKQADYELSLKAFRHVLYPKKKQIAERFIKLQKLDLAALCFIFLSDFANAGNCFLLSDQPERAMENWRRCLNNLTAMNIIAQFCINFSQVEFGGRFFLSAEPENYQLYSFFSLEEDRDSSFVVRLMDLYLKDRDNKIEITKWLAILDRLPRAEDIVHKKLYYSERIGNWNKFFMALKKDIALGPNSAKNLKALYIQEYEKIKDQVSEMTAIKLHFMEKINEFDTMVGKLQINENNYELFAVSKHIDQAIEFLQQRGELETLKRILFQNRKLKKLAEILAQTGDWEDAADLYFRDREWHKAAEMFVKAQIFYKAGESYYNAREYHKALEMFLKNDKWRSKQAMTYEKLGQYAVAANIWRQLGKVNKYRRCMQRLQGPTLFDL